MKLSLLISHFATAIIITGVILLIYASVQQAHRSAANDPQIQIARDLSDALGKGKTIDNFLSKDTIDLSQSLAVFTEIFDKNGKPIQSTGFINGTYPQPPPGVFDFTNANNEDMVSWQPQSDVRLAMVFEKISSPVGGFVAAGRSLKEIEIRENDLLQMVGITWAICMAVLLIHFLVQNYLRKKNIQ